MFRATGSPAPPSNSGQLSSALARTVEGRGGAPFTNLERGKKDEVDTLPKVRRTLRSISVNASVEQASPRGSAGGSAASSLPNSARNSVLAPRKCSAENDGSANAQRANLPVPGRSVAPKTSFKRHIVVEQPFAPPTAQRSSGGKTDRRALLKSLEREEPTAVPVAGKREFRRTRTAPNPTMVPSNQSSRYVSEEDECPAGSRRASKEMGQCPPPLAAPEELDFQAIFSSPEDSLALEAELTKELAEFRKIMGGPSLPESGLTSDQLTLLASTSPTDASSRTPSKSVQGRTPSHGAPGRTPSNTRPLPPDDSIGFDSLLPLGQAGSPEETSEDNRDIKSPVSDRGSNSAAAAAAANILQPRHGSDGTIGSTITEATPPSTVGPKPQWRSTWLSAAQRAQKKAFAVSTIRKESMISTSTSSTWSASGSQSQECSSSDFPQSWGPLTPSPRGAAAQGRPKSCEQAVRSASLQTPLKDQKLSEEAQAPVEHFQEPKRHRSSEEEDFSNRRSVEDLDRDFEAVLSGYGETVPTLGEGDEAFSEDVLMSIQAQQSNGNAADKALSRLANWSGGALPQDEDGSKASDAKKDRRKSYADAMGSTMSRVRHKLAAVKNQFMMSSVAEDAKEHLARETLASQLNSEPARPNGKKRMGFN